MKRGGMSGSSLVVAEEVKAAAPCSPTVPTAVDSALHSV
jgi:hypothetical protein